MDNPDRIDTWKRMWDTIRSSWRLYFKPFNLKWWFTFGDYIMERVKGSNNAGDFKFRLNMVLVWFVLWTSIIIIVPNRYEFFPFMVVLWSGFIWSRD